MSCLYGHVIIFASLKHFIYNLSHDPDSDDLAYRLNTTSKARPSRSRSITGRSLCSLWQDGGAHRVHAGGPGLERGEQNMPNEFNVWTREAGAGSLAISVEGPSKAEIDFKDRKDGSCYVSYIVSEPGMSPETWGASFRGRC